MRPMSFIDIGRPAFSHNRGSVGRVNRNLMVGQVWAGFVAVATLALWLPEASRDERKDSPSSCEAPGAIGGERGTSAGYQASGQ